MSRDLPDRRTHAYREDLAAAALRNLVEAPRYVEPTAASIVAPSAPLRRRPSDDSPLDTEALYGEQVDVLDTADGWSWVQLRSDGYVGYLPATAVAMDRPPPTHRVQALATFVFPAPDIKAPPRMCLPLGAEVVAARSDERFVELDTGGYVFARHLAERDRFARDFVDIAERFLGTPYLWGGRTRSGLDCSGLLQISLRAGGISAPRDSDMQETVLGENVLVPDNHDGLERGDLVFWPGHVGIMVDGVMLLHANAHHMVVTVEPLRTAALRIEREDSRIRAIKRLPGLSAAASAPHETAGAA